MSSNKTQQKKKETTTKKTFSLIQVEDKHLAI